MSAGLQGGRVAVALTIVLCITFTGCQTKPEKKASTAPDADARIAFYQKKIGGPATYPWYARLGLAYAQKARETGKPEYYERAKKQFLQSLNYQRNYEALVGAAIAFSELHQFREGLGYAEEAVQTLPSDVDAQGILFDIQLALGQVEKAESTVNRMVKEMPGFVSYTRLTAMRACRGDLAGAIQAMEKAKADAENKKLAPSTRAWAEVRLGSLLVEHCEADKGRAAYGRALALIPDYYFALEHIAELEAARGRTQEAAAIYQKILSKVPDPRYRLALAELYVSMGKPKEAQSERQRAASEWKGKIDAGAQSEYRPYALLLLEEKRMPEALQVAEKDWAIRRDTFAADTLAYAHFKNHHLTEAKKYIEQALHWGTRDTLVLLHGAEIYLEIGERDHARELMEKAAACPQSLGPGDRLVLSKLGEVLKRS